MLGLELGQRAWLQSDPHARSLNHDLLGTCIHGISGRVISVFNSLPHRFRLSLAATTY
jgi:hypothetical protein